MRVVNSHGCLGSAADAARRKLVARTRRSGGVRVRRTGQRGGPRSPVLSPNYRASKAPRELVARTRRSGGVRVRRTRQRGGPRSPVLSSQLSRIQGPARATNRTWNASDRPNITSRRDSALPRPSVRLRRPSGAWGGVTANHPLTVAAPADGNRVLPSRAREQAVSSRSRSAWLGGRFAETCGRRLQRRMPSRSHHFQNPISLILQHLLHLTPSNPGTPPYPGTGAPGH